MPVVDLVDETYVRAAPARLAAVFRDPASWPSWWPTLRLHLAEDRGREGVRWWVSGQLTGTSEVWLERYRDGTVVHFYLRVDPRDAPPPGRLRTRLADRLRRHHALSFKRRINRLKDELEHRAVVASPSRR
ncbi:MAG: polyketide cyclase / dehydrase and lipid transport [Streptosporangiales bacterium]|nr:polyketide cyclase / dehydrase and lipid transport [Streptosporangiales bacterium]MBO0890662.1 polyketide cyclase / dehydrase and lipid transport [Acidothermales bacterium]